MGRPEQAKPSVVERYDGTYAARVEISTGTYYTEHDTRTEAWDWILDLLLSEREKDVLLGTRK